jgi:MSHA biogenesis protein MshN
MNRYTDIGEAVVTSTLSGKAKIRLVQNRGLRGLVWFLLVAIILGLAGAFWLGLGKQQSGDEFVPGQGEGRQAAVQPAAIAPRVAVPPAVPAEESKPQAAASPEAEPPSADKLSTQQQAQNALGSAQQLERQGKVNEALEKYRSALLLDPTNGAARQAMVDLLLKTERTGDAERALQIGLKYNPKQTGYAMQLAHLQVDKDEIPQALDTLMKSLPYAGKQAEYQALIASLLQHQNRHASAVVYYKKALALQPDSGEWLMGLGVSLKALGQADAAANAFRKALETHNLSAQSRAFVEQQIVAPAANPQ